MVKKILVVDDEQDIVDLISYNLRKEGYDVSSAMDGAQAVELATSIVPDLMILDVMMPELDGYDVCRKLRENPSTTKISIVFLTAKSGEVDQILGLELGAEDYLQKPISPRVLVARVRSVLRRKDDRPKAETIAAPELLKIGWLEINRQSYSIKVDGEEQILPKKEFELLSFLASNAGKVFSREVLLSRVWGESIHVIDRTVDVHVSKLRERLKDHSDWIETVKGVGYRFRKAAEE